MLIQSWDEELDSSSTSEILYQAATVIAHRIEDASEREYLIACLARNDVHSLCDHSPAYGRLTPSDCRLSRQVTAFFAKRSDLELGIDRRGVAIRKFLDSEVLCAETNFIFKKRAAGEFLFSPAVEARLFRAQRKVAFILGDVPCLSDLKFRFGPGATTTLIKRKASARAKLGETFACSEDFAEGVKTFLEEFPSWIPFGDSEATQVSVEIHDGRLDFVRKNAKTDRTIVVEPMLNSMFQLGVGDYMATRLRRVGIDIRDQSRNQGLACEGSLTGALATLDLSSASDTIATELVYELLPVDWALFLSQGRSSHLVYEDFRFSIEKFSSMGNGFTFPLETLIFYALACACVNEDDEYKVSVYGDDIIVPTYAYAELCDLLNAVGFIPNKDKSFSTGPFRESCGADYHSGINIRPCYVKGPLTGQDVFRLHNFFVRNGEASLASYFADLLSSDLKIWGPDGYGDGHLIGGDPPRPHGRGKGYCGYVFETYTYRPRWSFTTSKGDAVLPSYSTYVRGDSDGWNGRVIRQGSPYFEAAMREVARSTDDALSKGVYRFDRSGRLGVTLPGKKGYNRVSVYTLTN